MDHIHALYFGYMSVATLVFAVTSTVSILLRDCGQVPALVLGYASYTQSYNLSVQLLVNIAIQMWLVRHPWHFECENFARNSKGVVWLLTPGYSVIVTVALYFIGSKPRSYYFLRGTEGDDKAPGLIFECFLADFPRGVTQRVGFP